MSVARSRKQRTPHVGSLAVVALLVGISLASVSSTEARAEWPDPLDRPVEPLRPPVALDESLRLVDTRPDAPTFDGKEMGAGRLAAGAIYEIDLAGRDPIFDEAVALFLNVAAVQPSAAGYLTVYPCYEFDSGGRLVIPSSSNVNYVAGDVVANAVFTGMSHKDRVCVYSHAETDIIVDLNAYTVDKGTPTSLYPRRLMDSRIQTGSIRVSHLTYDAKHQETGPVAAGSVYALDVRGRGGVSDRAESFILNVTAVDPQAPGFLTLFPCGGEIPTASNVNYLPGEVVPNQVFVKSGDDGDVCIYSLAETEVLVDVVGQVTRDVDFPSSIEPQRLLDSREGVGTSSGSPIPPKRIGAGETIEIDVLPEGTRMNSKEIKAAFLNVTAVFPSAPGFLTVFPCGVDRPSTSSVNYAPGAVTSNSVFSGVEQRTGKLCVYSLAETDVVVDISGFVPRTEQVVHDCHGIATVMDPGHCDALTALSRSFVESEMGWLALSREDGAWHEGGDGWSTSTDPCSWQYVECPEFHGDLYSLNFHTPSGNSLDDFFRVVSTGIPAEFSTFTHVYRIDFGIPYVVGDLNPGLGFLVEEPYLLNVTVCSDAADEWVVTADGELNELLKSRHTTGFFGGAWGDGSCVVT